MFAGATSMPGVSVGRMIWSIVARPSARTSAMERSTVLRLIPSPAVRLACGSMSTQRTLNPSSASAPPRLIAVVVLPTPPFWFAIAITLVTGTHLETLYQVDGDGVRPRGGSPCYRRPPCPGHEVFHRWTELFTDSVDM